MANELKAKKMNKIVPRLKWQTTHYHHTISKDLLIVYDGSHDVRAAWYVDEGGQEDLTKKYVGGKVSKTFVDNTPICTPLVSYQHWSTEL